MSAQNFWGSKWSYIVGGVMIGIIVSIGFNMTSPGHASQDGNVIYQPASMPPPADPQDLNVANQLSNAFAAVAKDVNPSVVTIFTESTIKMSGQSFNGSPFEQFFGDDFFNHFFQRRSPQGDMKQHGLGSGVIVDSDGIILTNNHVVKDADDIKVRLMDGREFKAEVKGTDSQTDLAVISIDASDLKPIKLGDSDKARVGDWVLAIGSPLQPELEHTVTAGIISAKGRSGVGLSQYEDFIQTDAAINPGNSGGGMVNLHGELVGINAAIATQNGGFMGIGFAIPVNLAKKVMSDILEKGKVVRGWLGVYIQTITPEIAKALNLNRSKGVIVSKVQKDSPAEKYGLKDEDVVIKFNGKDVANSTELSTWVAGSSPDAEITLTVLRDGDEKDINIKLGELTPDKQNLADGTSQFDKVGLTVSNITNDVSGKYHLPDNVKGVVITSVNPNGIAAANGLREGDIVVKLNKSMIESVDQFSDVLNNVDDGDMVLFFIQRGRANLYVAFQMPEK
ncbi:MAG: DegQ family serine endoprotease [Calditrichae bacterium]|nr:DegQ family serine endoprotease [Calditrichia bacterium]